MTPVLLSVVVAVALSPLVVRVVERAPAIRAPSEPTVPSGPDGAVAPASAPALQMMSDRRGVRPEVAVATGLATVGVFALVTARLGAVPALPAFLLLAAAGVALAVIDLRTSRLPDVVVLPTGAGVLLLLGVAAVAQDAGGALGRAVAAMVALFLFYLAQALVWPGALGMGDVKLAGLLGLVLGWLGWGEVVVGTVGANVLGVCTGLAVAAARRTGLRTRFPFGPAMLAGALLAILVGDRLARAWVDLASV